MEHCSNLLRDKSVILICLVTSVFISMMSDGVTSFSRIKTLRNICKRLELLQSKSFHAMLEIWRGKIHLSFRRFLFVRIEIESCLQVICCPIYHWLSVIRQ